MRFCQYRFDSAEVDWSSLGAQDLVGFVRQEAARLQRNLGKPPAVALRAMLRFLIAEGQVPRGLETAGPMPRDPQGNVSHFRRRRFISTPPEPHGDETGRRRPGYHS